MEQFKRAQVIMLPTQLNTCNLVPIIKYINGKLQYLNMKFTNNSLIGQHLYIISDDEIKKSDFYIVNNQVKKCIEIQTHQNFKYCIDELDNADIITTCKKIIVTTDTSLTINTLIIDTLGSGIQKITLPQPSQQFIEKYIESYNKGNIITDVLVEYEQTKLYEEVIKLIKSFANNYQYASNDIDYNKWIEENL